MPLYEYLCDACGHRFEVIQKFSDPPVEVCQKCGSRVQKVLSSPAIHFKGSGFYITDYAKKAYTEESKRDSAKGDTAKSDAAKSDSGKSEAGTGETSKSDAKPAGGSGSGGSSSEGSGGSSKPAPATKSKDS